MTNILNKKYKKADNINFVIVRLSHKDNKVYQPWQGILGIDLISYMVTPLATEEQGSKSNPSQSSVHVLRNMTFVNKLPPRIMENHHGNPNCCAFCDN